MIKKVLIAEDHESANFSLQKTLDTLNITNPDNVYYCDDAYMKIQKAVQAKESYDLLITDLYFEKDHREQKISDGIALIQAVREVQPDLKILVFSSEGRVAIIEKLYSDFSIDGYVRKARRDFNELLRAFETISNNQIYRPFSLTQHVKQNTYEFTTYDIIILTQLSVGKKQDEIVDYLKENNINPSAKSSIEKRLKLMKEKMNFNTNEQLLTYCAKMGII